MSKLHVCVLTDVERHGWVNPQLTCFLLHLGPHSWDFPQSYIPVQRARNISVENFLRTDSEWFLTFDNDVMATPELAGFIEQAIEDGKLIAVPRFHSTDFHDPRKSGRAFLAWNPLSNPIRGPRGDARGWQQLQGFAFMCVMIHRSVFEKLKKPYFDYLLDAEGTRLQCPEDFYFCERAAEAGFTLWGNVNYAVAHAKTVSLEAIAQAHGSTDMNGNADVSKPNAAVAFR